MPKRRQKVKRYHRSFYSRGTKIKKAIGIVVLAAVVLGAAWLAAPYVLDWATHTWYTVVRDRDLSASSEGASSGAASSEAASSEAASSQAASSEAASSAPEAVAGTAIREGSWSVVSLSALGDEASIRAQAQALAGQAEPEAFLLKILFTAVTLGAGFRGGEIVPVLFTGATFGCVAAPVVGLSPSFGGALGMAATFCGTTNCPISSVLLAFELFGGESLGLFALCCAVSYMLSGYYGLYSEQKIVYSKFRPEWVDKKAQ